MIQAEIDNFVEEINKRFEYVFQSKICGVPKTGLLLPLRQEYYEEHEECTPYGEEFVWTHEFLHTPAFIGLLKEDAQDIIDPVRLKAWDDLKKLILDYVETHAGNTIFWRRKPTIKSEVDFSTCKMQYIGVCRLSIRDLENAGQET